MCVDDTLIGSTLLDMCMRCMAQCALAATATLAGPIYHHHTLTLDRIGSHWLTRACIEEEGSQSVCQ